MALTFEQHTLLSNLVTDRGGYHATHFDVMRRFIEGDLKQGQAVRKIVDYTIDRDARFGENLIDVPLHVSTQDKWKRPLEVAISTWVNTIYEAFEAAQIATASNNQKVALHTLRRGDEPEVTKIEVDTICCGSWGYDQTNIDFWRCIRRTKTMAVLERLETVVIGQNGADYTSELVEPGAPTGETIRRKIKTSTRGGRPQEYVKYDTWAGAPSLSPWDGTSKRQTNSMYGH